ncbi:MAG TPA: FAD-dependent oxidoreductase, partial [Candidatus Limnocylindrales bacterium]|nr:FAD-dependent oxidoreductase [Candidatus Limnocylindrales bacterium]
PGLKSIDDATEIRRRILIAFEAAEREHVQERRREWMTFVVVGGGPTGVELAGALGEIANDTLRRDFRSINSRDARIVLVEALDRVLPNYPKDRSASARRQLRRLGVDVRTGTKVIDIDEHAVTVEPTAGGAAEKIPAHTVLWAAGVQASSFAKAVAAATGAETDKAGRVKVGPDLTIPGHPEIYLIGDAAIQPWKPDKAVPGVAQGGIQGGRYAAAAILARLDGETPKPFRFSNRGEVAVIGRLSGVTDIPWLGPFGRTGGFLAWLLWLGIHISYLIGFANRLVVLTKWGWSFLTHGRGSRLITGQPLLPDIEEPEPPA